MTSFDAPLSEPELAFLDKVEEHVKTLFVVVNKLDLRSPADAENVVRYVCERHRAERREARLRGDAGALTASGLPEFQRALVRFLAGERSQVFLLQAAARAERLLAHEKFHRALHSRVQAEDAAERQARWQRLDERVAELASEIRHTAATAIDEVDEQFRETLLERSREWPEELNGLLLRKLEEIRPAPAGRVAATRLRALQAEAEELARDALAPWLKEHVAEARSLLLVVARGKIDALLRSPRSVDAIAAELFGTRAEHPVHEPRLSAVEFPGFAVASVEFTLPLRLPWWLYLRPAKALEKDGYRPLHDALDEGVAHYCAGV